MSILFRHVDRWIGLGGALTATGGAACTVAVLEDVNRLFSTGLVCIILAAMCAAHHSRRKHQRAFHEIWTTAYDQGYDDGARHATNRIVKLDGRRNDARPKATPKREVAGDGTAP